MIIQTKFMEESGWRIAGADLDWEIQTFVKDSKSETGYRWKGIYFFSNLEYALKFAYEKALRESRTEAKELKAAMAECRRVKDELAEAAKEALK